ncbi:TerC family protein [Adhaeretor mobilis]|uniref:Integral membrane protein TerC family protein n=1 Tax=Adhaeretor mobilis TaxID=1930276 RepID=A0A517MU93_9BACT|nr:tellurium resistance protein TerC [Adhaeretor mobilis]QDS98451.1 Integral membrane protein TerC family protein [Adhaeretor mobilis]
MELFTLDGVFTIESLFTLFMLILLQAVLGFDNLLYISIESKRAPVESQASVRKWGILLAVALRLVLLFVVMKVLKLVAEPLFGLHWEGILEFEATLHAIIELIGGIFILYTALREIMHMLAVEHLEGHGKQKPKSVVSVVTTIVIMNLIFSFDSILSALALTEVFVIMAVAIVISGIMMVWLADHVSDFLRKNRMYEVLGLFILFIVGVMLISEGGHLAHLKLFGYEVEAMAKTTFYFVIAILVVIDVVQGRYQKKLLAQREHELAHSTDTAPVA